MHVIEMEEKLVKSKSEKLLFMMAEEKFFILYK